jgi:hypothetical protein
MPALTAEEIDETFRLLGLETPERRRAVLCLGHESLARASEKRVTVLLENVTEVETHAELAQHP